MECGLVIGGKVVPKTSWILREPTGWWTPGDRGSELRAGVADVLVCHWTAGKPFEGPDSGRRAVRNARARDVANIGYHFLIVGDGHAWQTADLALTVTHIGTHARTKRRSISIEHAWPGLEDQARRLGVVGRILTRTIQGERYGILEPSSAMLGASVKLAETLAALPPEYGIRIPRQVPVDRDGHVRLSRFSMAEQNRWSGAQGHLHVPGSAKADEAGIVLEAYRSAGWRGVTP